jgi:hypothetical protein
MFPEQINRKTAMVEYRKKEIEKEKQKIRQIYLRVDRLQNEIELIERSSLTPFLSN